MLGIKNELKNVMYEGIYYIINILINLIIRKMVITYIGLNAISLNHLLNQIVNFIALIEFGVYNIMLFNLYSAIKGDNKNRINDIMIQFKNVYRKISFCIFVIGVLFIPFLKIFINKYNGNINYVIIYLLTLFQISFTFLFSYKIYLLQAYRKTYVYIRIMILCKIISFFLEINILYFIRNYYIFFIVFVLNDLIMYYIISKYINKKYSYLNEKADIRYKIDIKNHIKETGVSKVCNTLNQCIDSLVISIIMPISNVGLFSNYYLLVNSICYVFQKIYSSFKAKIANFVIDNNDDRLCQTFYFLHNLSYIIAVIISVLFYIFIDKIIILWIGNKYVLSKTISLMFSLQIFFSIYRINLWEFISINGWFKISKISDLIGSTLNLILSIVLGIKFRIEGVVVATVISYTVQFIIELYMINIKLKSNNILIYIKEILLVLCYLMMLFLIKKVVVISFILFILLKFYYINNLKKWRYESKNVFKI